MTQWKVRKNTEIVIQEQCKGCEPIGNGATSHERCGVGEMNDSDRNFGAVSGNVNGEG